MKAIMQELLVPRRYRYYATTSLQVTMTVWILLSLGESLKRTSLAAKKDVLMTDYRSNNMYPLIRANNSQLNVKLTLFDTLLRIVARSGLPMADRSYNLTCPPYVYTKRAPKSILDAQTLRALRR